MERKCSNIMKQEDSRCVNNYKIKYLSVYIVKAILFYSLPSTFICMVSRYKIFSILQGVYNCMSFDVNNFMYQ